MRLLVITQTVDRAHPVLGFFHRWIEVLASRFESVEVICLGGGEYQFPANVHVHSLGKEKGGNRLTYTARFLKLVRTLSYDSVFVHMNPEYVLLAGGYWRSRGKKIALWYNHEKGGWRLRRAAKMVDRLFHTSPYAASARYPHAVRMPAGVDTELFAPQSIKRVPQSIYFQGRIAPAKQVHVLLEALRQLRSRGIQASASLVGPEEPGYGARLRKDFADLIEAQAITFLGPRRNYDTPALYATHAVSVNLTAAGNYDKTVPESLASGTPAIVSSPAFTDLIASEWVIKENDAGALALALERLLSLPHEQYRALSEHGRAAVIAHDSLAALIDALVERLPRPKVLMAINCMNIGGAPSVVLTHLQELKQVEPWLMTLYPSKPANFLPDARKVIGEKRVVEFRLKNRNLFDVATLWQLYRFLRRERFDTVVTHLFLANILVRPLAALAGVHRIISFEHSRYEGKHLWQIWADWLLSFVTYRIVVANEEIARFTSRQEWIPKSKFAVIPNPVSLPPRDESAIAACRREWQVPADKLVFLSVGRFAEEKGHEYLIRAAAKCPDVFVLIIGHGPLKEKLEQVVREVGAQASCHVVTDPKRARLAFYLANTFVLPSLREGASLVTAEAMMAGLPVIVSDLPTLRALVPGPDAGILVPPRDVDALAAAIRRLAADEELRTRLAQRSLETAKRFSVQTALSEFKRVTTRRSP